MLTIPKFSFHNKFRFPGFLFPVGGGLVIFFSRKDHHHPIIRHGHDFLWGSSIVDLSYNFKTYMENYTMRRVMILWDLNFWDLVMQGSIKIFPQKINFMKLQNFYKLRKCYSINCYLLPNFEKIKIYFNSFLFFYRNNLFFLGSVIK